MGLRGPGARPVKKPTKPQLSVPKRQATWRRAGLSRSERVIRFVQSLNITAGPDAGKPFRLRDWQKDIIRRVYDPVGDDGRRLVRTALLTMGRKNGKTGMVAALALAHLCGPRGGTAGAGLLGRVRPQPGGDPIPGDEEHGARLIRAWAAHLYQRMEQDADGC